MIIHAPKPLPDGLHLACYACNQREAAYLCRFTIEEMAIQVCLCSACVKLEPSALLQHTVGIQEDSGISAAHYLTASQSLLPGSEQPIMRRSED